jgi:hypothetical protein
MARRARAVAAIPVIFLLSCNLVTQTQVSFWNNTSTYTFLAIKIGGVDYTTALAPGSVTSYFPIAPGTYSLSTEGISGAWYQWPAPQQIARGYSYQLVFSIDASNSLSYSTYVAMIQ